MPANLRLIGKILGTIGFVLVTPGVLDFVTGWLLRRSAEELMKSFDAWADRKSTQLQQLSVPSELLGALGKARSILLDLLLACSCVLMLMGCLLVPLGVLLIASSVGLIGALPLLLQRATAFPLRALFWGTLLAGSLKALIEFVERAGQDPVETVLKSRLVSAVSALFGLGMNASFLCAAAWLVSTPLKDWYLSLPRWLELSLFLPAGLIFLIFYDFLLFWIPTRIGILPQSYYAEGFWTVIGYYIGQIVISVLIAILLIATFLLQAMIAFARYVLLVLAHTTIERVFFATGSICGLLAIWLS